MSKCDTLLHARVEFPPNLSTLDVKSPTRTSNLSPSARIARFDFNSPHSGLHIEASLAEDRVKSDDELHDFTDQ